MLDRVPRPSPRTVLALGVGYLVLTWALFVAVDVHDVAGSRVRLGVDEPGTALWFLLFTEGGFTEWLQWSCLAAAAIYAMAAAMWDSARQHSAATRAWFMVSIGMGLLVIEDAGNPSHRFGSYLRQLGLFEFEIVALAGGRLLFFLAIVAIVLYPFIVRREHVWRFATTRRHHLIGFAAYAIAVFGSVPSNMFFSGYRRVGDFLVYEVFGGRLVPLPEGHWGGEDPLGFVLMDSLVEESIELVGATFLLAAVLAHLQAASASDEVASCE